MSSTEYPKFLPAQLCSTCSKNLYGRNLVQLRVAGYFHRFEGGSSTTVCGKKLEVASDEA